MFAFKFIFRNRGGKLFHNSVSPLVFRHRIPEWPSPLKSLVARRHSHRCDGLVGLRIQSTPPFSIFRLCRIYREVPHSKHRRVPLATIQNWSHTDAGFFSRWACVAYTPDAQQMLG
jgi:hypothetical protein